MAAKKIDQKGYNFYVCLHLGTGTKIESGWEYREDAKEQQSEVPVTTRIYVRKTLVAQGLDPAKNSSWMTAADWKNDSNLP